MNIPKPYITCDVSLQDIGHSLQHCREWYPNWVIIIEYGLTPLIYISSYMPYYDSSEF